MQALRSRARGSFHAVLAIAVVGFGLHGRALGQCAGDCNGDSTSSLAELIRSVAIALGELPLANCAAIDADGDQAARISDITHATRALLGGCGVPAPGGPRAGGLPVLTLSSPTGAPGTSVTFNVTLDADGESIAGIQNDIAYQPEARVSATALNRPSCRVNPAINKTGSAFAFQPPGCTPGSTCVAIRALILALDNVDPIPDGSVLYECDVDIAPSAAAGVYPLDSFNELSSDPNGVAIATAGVDGSVIVGTATCGDGTSELDEECDDGNTLGGDGCAANCTAETVKPFILDSTQSTATIQTESFPVQIQLAGHINFRVGSARPSDPTRTVPVAARATDVAFEPTRVTGLLCACVRAVPNPSFGAGVSSQGAISCTDGGLSDVDYTLVQDHNTTPGAPANRLTGTPDDPECDDQTMLPGGQLSQACLEGVGLNCLAGLHAGACNGPRVLSVSGGGAPAGSASITNLLSISLLQDRGLCANDPRLPNGSCEFADYGPDCQPCTDDDLNIAAAEPVFTTTGRAEASLFDANNSESVGPVPGQTVAIERNADCLGPCVTFVSGTTFDCDQLLDHGSLAGALAGAFTGIDTPTIGDHVTTVRLVNFQVPPTPTPQGTATSTATRTASRTGTATPTQPVVTAPGSLILRKARLRADGGARGTVRIEAVVDTNPPLAPLLDEIAAGGIQIQVLSDDGTSLPLAWSAAQCTSTPSGRGPRITCVNGDRKIRFRPLGTPNLYDLRLIARRLNGLPPPLGTEPVTLQLQTGTSLRQDAIGNCQIRGAGEVKTCKETGIQPTPTTTATGTSTATSTRTHTGTATRTRTSTRTRTPTNTSGPSSTPTDTPTPGPLGTRVFSIEPGVLTAGADLSRTGLFSSGLSGVNAAIAFSAGPLTLVGGLPDGDGIASLTLQDDVTIEVQIVDGSRLCLQLQAAASTGSIDCDGGTAYDIVATRPLSAPGIAFTFETGQGPPAGPGNGDLLISTLLQHVPPSDTTACDDIAYTNPPQTLAFTTTTATATISSTVLSLSIPGEPFDCGTFSLSGSGGMLAAPQPAFQPPIGDVVNVIRLGEELSCVSHLTCSLRSGVCVGGSNAGAPCTANAQCSAGGGTCNFDRRCVGGVNQGDPCTSDVTCSGGTCPTLGDISKIELNVAALPIPLAFALRGSITMQSGPGCGNTPTRCGIGSVDPINIPAIGVVCIQPATEPCPDRRMDCSGAGDAVGLDILTDGNIGACLSNEACAASCDAYCIGLGKERQTSGCTGQCSGPMPQNCTADSECGFAGNGMCNGPDPVGSFDDICQCDCIDRSAGGANQPGDFQCDLGASLVVESSAPCNGTDVSIFIGNSCVPLTTATLGSRIRNTNFNPEGCPGGGPPCMLPSSGPVANVGNPLTCAEYQAGISSGLKAVGAANFFGSALGDLATEMFFVCE